MIIKNSSILKKNTQIKYIKSALREIELLKFIVNKFIPKEHIDNIKEHCKLDEITHQMYIENFREVDSQQKIDTKKHIYIRGIDNDVFEDHQQNFSQNDNSKETKKKKKKNEEI